MILPLIFLWWCSCVVVTIDAFTTTTPTKKTGVVTSPSALSVSVVSKFLTKEEAETKINDTFENQTPDSVGINDITAAATSTTENDQQQQQEASSSSSSSQILSKRGRRRNRRKHNYSQQRKFLKEKPDLDFYTLHSSAVSHLERDTPINDIM